jgi:crotonobetainyl-CoA:carnitine CoA-transferase CaiB-like acyl-CoA transferase
VHWTLVVWASPQATESAVGKEQHICRPTRPAVRLPIEEQAVVIMDGVRVVEVAVYGFVPSAASVLSDWGADVMKIEDPLKGDPIRGLDAFGVAPGVGGVTCLWEVFNRGKRSIGVDLRTDEGREILLKLVDSADVFLTNFLAPARKRLGIDVDDIRGRNPRIIYGRGTGQGPQGAEADKGGFDGISYWGRTGMSLAARPFDYERPIDLPGPAFGDIQAGMHLAGGIAAALYQREKSGEGCVVDVSLLGAGLWAMQASLAGAFVLDKEEMPKREIGKVGSPLGGTFRTSDGRFIVLSMLEADRYWPAFRTLIGDPELLNDDRFVETEGLFTHRAEAFEMLRRIFEKRTLDDWKELLGRQEGQWAVIQTSREALADPQSHDNGYLKVVNYDNGATLPMVVPPVQFDGVSADLKPAPELGANTEQALLELGCTWPEIVELKDRGVVS